MTSERTRHCAWRHLIAVVSLAVTASLINHYGNAQELSTHRTWQIGAFAAGGFPPAYELHSPSVYYGVQLDLLNAGAQIGKMLSAPRGSGILRGQGEGIVEVMPFWLAHYPLQKHYIHFVQYPGETSGYSLWGPYSIHGVSVTPLLYRWNFTGRLSGRSVPWAQLGGGLLWTNHKFPLLGGDTSVINFTPQVGVGENIFIRRNRSLDFAMKAVHISNASLGDNNPGLNVTLQFSAGYSWWK